MYRNMMRGKRGECLEDDLRRNAWMSGSYINRQCVNSRHSTAGMNAILCTEAIPASADQRGYFLDPRDHRPTQKCRPIISTTFRISCFPTNLALSFSL